jgi:uncharacterized RDD family membrane protein YckC/AAA+ ATPase superfamily predicted ATPase
MATSSPYRGLDPYGEADWPYFFGRERECEIVTANLMAARLTLMYGSSGVGKTSVLRAGVSHHLEELARDELPGAQTPDRALVIFSRWRDEPVAALQSRIHATVARALGEPTPPSVDDVVSLAETLQAASERLNGQLLIILDQFEEYFLYHAQDEGPGSFSVEFPRAVNWPGLRANFLIAIREDALAKLDRFKARLPTLFTNYLRLDYLDRDSARSAIEQPIQRFNSLQPPLAPAFTIEPELTQEILKQVGSDTELTVDFARDPLAPDVGTGLIDTSYLQVVMTRLWTEEQLANSRVLRLGTLQRLGNARDILRTHLDESMRTLPDDQQDAAAEIFHYLVTPSGTKIAHAPTDLANYTGLDAETVEQVLSRLAEREGGRLLRSIPPFGRQREARYEIRHDRLAEPVLSWRTEHKKRGLEQEREQLLQQLDRERVEAAQREERASTVAVQVTRRRFVLPAAWTGLFWVTQIVSAAVLLIQIVFLSPALPLLLRYMLDWFLLGVGAAVSLAVAAGVVALSVRSRAKRLKRRQTALIGMYWAGGALVGLAAGTVAIVGPVFAVYFASDMFSAQPERQLVLANGLLVMLGVLDVVVALVVQGALSGGLTLREVDRAGGFDIRPARPESVYAAFWRRTLAICIDLGLCAFFWAAVALFGYGALIIPIGWVYFALYESSAWQATPGKRAMGICVTDSHQNRISFPCASVRIAAKCLSAALLCAGFVMALFTKQHQALHDKMAGTLVLRTPAKTSRG